MNFQTVLDEMFTGQPPQVDPYLLIMQDYIGAWVEDIREALLDNKTRLYRNYRNKALDHTLAGMLGQYEDRLLNDAARVLHTTPEQLWTSLYITAYKQARKEYNAREA